MIDTRNAHVRVIALKHTDSASVNEINRYGLLKALYRLRSSLDPGLRPLTDRQTDNLLTKIQTKCVALGIDVKIKDKIHQCDTTIQKVDLIDRFIRQCWWRFRLQNSMPLIAVVSITTAIGTFLLL